MAITIDWATKVITIPKADTTLISAGPPEIRELDVDAFRTELNDLQDDEEGIVFDTTHRHIAPVTVGGVTLARVVEIINGYTVTFENGSYAVNLDGANNNIGDVLNLNNVQVRSNNSAGLTYFTAIQDQSYLDAKVFIDTTGRGSSGQIYPWGTPIRPVDTWDDAEVIAEARKLNGYNLDGTLTLVSSNDIGDTDWRGLSPIKSAMVLAGGSAMNTTFERIGLTGVSSGRISAKTCALGGPLNLSGVQGIFEDCGINGNLTLDGAATENILFKDCASVIAGSSKPIVDCSSTTADIHFRAWVGGLEIRNFSGGNNMSIDVVSGSVLLDSTCTAGEIVVRGVADVTDNSGAGCTVIIDVVRPSAGAR